MTTPSASTSPLGSDRPRAGATAHDHGVEPRVAAHRASPAWSPPAPRSAPPRSATRTRAPTSSRTSSSSCSPAGCCPPFSCRPSWAWSTRAVRQEAVRARGPPAREGDARARRARRGWACWPPRGSCGCSLSGAADSAASTTSRSGWAPSCCGSSCPQLVLYAVGAVATALLNADRRFTAAAVAPVFNNLVVIATMVAFRAMRGGAHRPRPRDRPRSSSSRWAPPPASSR